MDKQGAAIPTLTEALDKLYGKRKDTDGHTFAEVQRAQKVIWAARKKQLRESRQRSK